MPHRAEEARAGPGRQGAARSVAAAPPLPWLGVPHVNAWALSAGDGVVLVDTGLYEPGALSQLELALSQAGLALEHVRLLVCTHAHSDHYGLAGPIVDAAGCELWMHPNHEHLTRAAADPDRMLERRVEVALQSGVPEEAVRRYQASRKGEGIGVARVVPPDRDLVEGGVRDRPRHLAHLRDARPRSLARGAPPAGPRPAAVGGPPAGPRLPLLRLRLDARSGRRVPPEPRQVAGLQTSTSAWPATGARSATCRPRSSSSGGGARAHQRVRSGLREGPRSAYELVPILLQTDELNPMLLNWGCQRRSATCAISRWRARWPASTASPSAGRRLPERVATRRRGQARPAGSGTGRRVAGSG